MRALILGAAALDYGSWPMRNWMVGHPWRVLGFESKTCVRNDFSVVL